MCRQHMTYNLSHTLYRLFDLLELGISQDYKLGNLKHSLKWYIFQSSMQNIVLDGSETGIGRPHIDRMTAAPHWIGTFLLGNQYMLAIQRKMRIVQGNNCYSCCSLSQIDIFLLGTAYNRQ